MEIINIPKFDNWTTITIKKINGEYIDDIWI